MAGSVALVSLLDFATYDFELCIATLYIVPIALACWLFGARIGVPATIAVTAIAVTKYPLLHHDPTVLAMLWNSAARATAFGILAAIVLAFRHSFEQAHYLASHDRMTGALNKEAFRDVARRALDHARSSEAPVMLAFLDLDGFKAVNDRHGHEAGDRVLRCFSSGAVAELRAVDSFGRVGGDEFAIILPLATLMEGVEVARNLHARLSAALGSTGHAVTCSMGALLVPPGQAYGRGQLMREADQLMYLAKHGGKDRVVIGTMPSGPVQDLEPMAVQVLDAPRTWGTRFN